MRPISVIHTTCWDDEHTQPLHTGGTPPPPQGPTHSSLSCIAQLKTTCSKSRVCIQVKWCTQAWSLSPFMQHEMTRSSFIPHPLEGVLVSWRVTPPPNPALHFPVPLKGKLPCWDCFVYHVYILANGIDHVLLSPGDQWKNKLQTETVLWPGFEVWGSRIKLTCSKFQVIITYI